MWKESAMRRALYQGAMLPTGKPESFSWEPITEDIRIVEIERCSEGLAALIGSIHSEYLGRILQEAHAKVSYLMTHGEFTSLVHGRQTEDTASHLARGGRSAA